MITTPSLYVVLQLGGSSSEYYFHSFEHETPAIQFIQSAENASYKCFGPVQIELPETANLLIAARQVLQEMAGEKSSVGTAAKALKDAVLALEAKFD